jgi:hypothetical protein
MTLDQLQVNRRIIGFCRVRCGIIMDRKIPPFDPISEFDQPSHTPISPSLPDIV